MDSQIRSNFVLRTYSIPGSVCALGLVRFFDAFAFAAFFFGLAFFDFFAIQTSS